ncbi:MULTISPECIES: dihydroxyacetone kinase subunit DhaL [Clostridioides]|uniref:dihydroxyacetone kinase subunit DhaL n=1 Tax=Clostridioides sp. ZZV14-6387 TaxID=2811497 RepID=UPI0007BBECD4|nr:dihydroxyacetone kinase subunit L [Clostridioides sp. ZZV14-6387]CZR96959.1 PTS-dependent dihydroxyacetone kinase, ADP-binding subunit DhaL [Clostridioides difficile]CZS06020.1 PTS-dependent dihydroxyacetone kinase, ADP-binding subunit DhaL [Clostridioides difficile]
MLLTTTWKKMLISAAEILKENKIYLCELDSVVGDGDHGVTIDRIADCMKKRALEENKNDSIKSINEDLSTLCMNVNGGSAGPLWGTIFEGMAEGIDDKDELEIEEIKGMFNEARENLSLISTAKIGQKTLVDALYPAIDAIYNVQSNDIVDIFRLAYEKAVEGAENTKTYIAKFGRAKSIGERSLGHMDPGAVSISLMFKGLYNAL